MVKTPAPQGTPLPRKPERIPIEQLAVKEAVGLALWNGLYGRNAQVFLAKVQHPNTGEELARFLGGSAVPTSTVSAWNQSLIWMQEYLNTSLVQEAIADYIVVHRALFLNIPMFENALNSGEQSVSSVPGYELHGLLPCHEAFLNRHIEKLVVISADSDGMPWMRPSLRISNPGQADLVKYILAGLWSGKLSCKVEVHNTYARAREPSPL